MFFLQDQGPRKGRRPSTLNTPLVHSLYQPLTSRQHTRYSPKVCVISRPDVSHVFLLLLDCGEVDSSLLAMEEVRNGKTKSNSHCGANYNQENNDGWTESTHCLVGCCVLCHVDEEDPFPKNSRKGGCFE